MAAAVPGKFFRCANLRCEYVTNPLASGTATPRLSWELASTGRGVFQSAFQILASTRIERLEAGAADLWDSGRVESDTTLVRYDGQKPSPHETVFWAVRAWDRSGATTAFSSAASWETGLLAPADWGHARWIAADYANVARPFPSPMFRKAVTLPKTVTRARACFCGLGYGELHLNGQKVGAQVLDPGQTDYETEALYSTLDLTSVLRKGENIFGVILGDGWFNQDRVWGGLSYGDPGFVLQIAIDFDDGSKEVVVSDGSWACTMEGPIRASNIYAGEIYDARREIPKWMEPHFDAAAPAWRPAQVVPPLAPVLRPQLMPAIQRTQKLPALARQRTQPGVWVYDFGQNFAGWCRLKVNAARGTEICLRFAEVLDPEGNIDPLSTGLVHTRVVQTDRYFCGGGEETWEPRFTYHGFRYVEVTGFPGDPPGDLLEGTVVHTALARAGTFECSDALLNRLHDTALWTERSNLHSVPTDCPARERCGWLGDAHVTAEMLLYNFDSVPFLEKYHRDILNSLGAGGGSPDVPTNIVPGKRRCGEANPDWAMAMILIPWYLYVYAGDRQVFIDSYDRLRRLLAHFQAQARGGILEAGYGDWCPPGRVEPNECPVALSSTALYYMVTRCLAHFARELERKPEAAEFETLAEAIRDSFIARFYDAGEGTYGSQTANALALQFELYPAKEKTRIRDSLRAEIETRHGGHFNVGLHGFRYLFEVLSRNGLEALCWDVIQVEGYPGFKHLFSLGATTFWETFYDPQRDHMLIERSRNHPMLGSFDAWLYQTVGGIAPDPGHPGFGRVILKPHLLGPLTFAKATYHSVRGPISSEWLICGNEFRWKVVLPANTCAAIYIPTGDFASVMESGRPIAGVPGMTRCKFEDGCCVCEVENGSFEFTAALEIPILPRARVASSG